LAHDIPWCFVESRVTFITNFVKNKKARFR
jgi:hypothetical protein